MVSDEEFELLLRALDKIEAWLDDNIKADSAVFGGKGKAWDIPGTANHQQVIISTTHSHNIYWTLGAIPIYNGDDPKAVNGGTNDIRDRTANTVHVLRDFVLNWKDCKSWVAEQIIRHICEMDYLRNFEA